MSLSRQGQENTTLHAKNINILVAEDAYGKGADAILSKPFKREELFDAINRALTRKQALWGTRNGERIRTSLELQVNFPELDLSARTATLNIGRGGMFVRLSEQLPPVGAQVTFKIQFERGNPSVIEGTGRVRWTRPPSSNEELSGCGIEFEYLTDESRQALIEYIDRNLPKSYIPKN